MTKCNLLAAKVSLLLFTLFLTAPSLQAQPLTFDQALQTAVQSPSFRMITEDLRAANGDYLSTLGAYLPQAGVSLAYTKDLDAAQTSGTIASPREPYDLLATLDVSQTLWNGSSLFKTLAAGKNSRAAGSLLTYRRQQFGLTVASAYYGAILARDALEIARQSLEIAQKSVEQAELSNQNGLLSDLDLKRARVKLQSVRPQILSATNLAANALRNLKLTIGLPLEQSVGLADSLTNGSAPEVPELDSVIARAFESRGDIQALTAQSEALGNLVTAGWMTYVPSLAAFYQLKQDRGGTKFDLTDAVTSRSNLLGARLNWGVFDGLTGVGNTQKAAANNRRLDRQIEYAREALRVDLTALADERRQTWEAMAAAESLAITAEEVMAEERNLLLNEMGTTLDLDNARLDLENARLTLARAKFDYLMATLRYRVQSGEAIFPQLR